MGLDGNSLSVAREITDKSIIRDKVKNVSGLSHPKFWICKDATAPEIQSFPVVVKPIAAGGKRGVSVVRSAEELAPSLEEAIKVSKIEGALIEEFLGGGQEYSVESLSYHKKHYVLQITQKDSSGPPHCVELGHHQPADISADLRARVISVISGILDAAGITDGPSHTEIKIIDRKIYLIEVNGRPGGDHIAYPLTELSTGYPYITGIIMASLGKLDESELEHTECNYCGVYFVTTQTAHLKDIFDSCESKPWFYKKNLVSDTLLPITHNDGFNTNYFMYFSKDGKPII
jgi:biotin carboxylase